MPIPASRRLHTRVRAGTSAATLMAAALLAGCSPEGASWSANAATAPDARVGSSAGSAASGTRAAFSGQQGQARAGGFTLQARDGHLALDGIAYGRVDAQAVSQLEVRDNAPIVTVNGQVRQPDNTR
jgi:hypothetical protein